MVAATACGVAAAYVPAVMGVMARVSFGVSRVMTSCGGISAVNRNEQKSTRQTKRGEQHHQFHRRLLRPHSNRFATARFLPQINAGEVLCPQTGEVRGSRHFRGQAADSGSFPWGEARSPARRRPMES